VEHKEQGLNQVKHGAQKSAVTERLTRGVTKNDKAIMWSKALADSAPKLVEFADRLLFDDVWERTDLSKRDRSLITVAALIALNRPDQLRSRESTGEWSQKR
jgi:alkylhydroperoxidase/carboxymuconolactone decarboxylase family protein YurZ